MKHTPGPWSVANWRDTDKADRLIATVAIVGDCVVGPQFAEPHQTSYENHGSDVADARLISAAPDLLAALKALDECYCEANNKMSRAQRAHHRKALLDARAAIAKATGEQS